ncbi:hypothetical protein AB0425_15240 [Actinosynnema sp. NPDC051121]
MTAEKLVLDDCLTTWDVEIAAHDVVAAPPEVTWRVARDLDLLGVHTPLLDAAMWVRGLPTRLSREPAVELTSLSFGDTSGMAGWVGLGERMGRELAVGAVGKYWQPDIEWRDVPAEEFAAFSEPGWGKIAVAVTTIPYGADRTLLIYVCRVATTDDASRRRFARYWWLIRPFVGHIMRATVRAIARSAQRTA